MREFHRVLSGAEYSRRLAAQAASAGVEIRLDTTVTALGQSGELSLSTREGRQLLTADRVVSCTGAREKPRSTRLVSGTRPQGVMTTGALQSMIYLQRHRPCKRPVIIGSEMVAYSAFLSCRHAGMQPVAMIEAAPGTSWWQLATLLPRLFGTPVLTNTSLQTIDGHSKVQAVTVKRPSGELATLDCDGVIFTGQFIGESSLAKMAGFAIDSATNSPLVDAYGRYANINYFASGNLCHPLKTAGQCWREGRDTASLVKASLDGKLPDTWVQKSA
jgi:thioredoxin reductase